MDNQPLQPKRPSVGVSSGSFSEMSGPDAAKMVRQIGGSVVDLRDGKGHGWERDGISPFVDAGIQISFIGISAVLGMDDAKAVNARHSSSLSLGLPIKVFCMKGALSSAHFPMTIALLDSLTEAVGARRKILVETHDGYASVDELLLLAQNHGVRILLDSLGLCRISRDPHRDISRLADYVDVVQVKGFDSNDAHAGGHRPLESGDKFHREMLLRVGQIESVTIESKSGTLESDIRVIQDLLKINQEIE